MLKKCYFLKKLGCLGMILLIISNISFAKEQTLLSINKNHKVLSKERVINDDYIILKKQMQIKPDALQIKKADDITGTILDDSNRGLPGASVKVKGGNSATQSDLNGNFTIKANIGDVLEISFLGYETNEISVKEAKIGKIYLKTKINRLEDVVVIGYGTTTKSDLTGAVGSVKAEEFAGQGAPTIAEVLQGRVAGVVVTSNDGTPGGGVSIRIRGTASTNASNDPLYVIDGFPIVPPEGTLLDGGTGASFNPLSNISPEDIESIEILKDASSTAIYGARGANGVVLVTTKKGYKGKANFSYNTFVGVQNAVRPYDVLESRDYAKLKYETVDGARFLPFADYESYKDSTNTNWQDLLLRTAMIQNHQLNAGGGFEGGDYNLSLGYFDQQGTLLETSFKRYNARLNVNVKLLPKVNLTSNIAYTTNTVDGVLNATSADVAPGAISQILYAPPTRKPDIQFNDDISQVDIDDINLFSNPLIYVKNVDQVRGYKNINWNSQIKYEVSKKFSLLSRFGFNNGFTDQNIYFGKLTQQGNRDGGVAILGNSTQQGIVSENIAQYNTKIKKHKIDLLGGVTFQSNTNNSINMRFSQFSNETFTFNRPQDASIVQLPINRNINKRNIMSGLSRVNYTYDNKYLLTASFRADGSSVFGERNKWGYFPSAAFAWKIIQEPFMSKSKVFSNLKLRTGFGITGNDRIPIYSSQATIRNENYVFGNNESITTGYAPIRAQINNLRWETTTSYNIGLDIGLLKNRITITTDIYQNYTKDLLLDVALPPANGFSKAIFNLGAKENKGIEFAIESKNINTKNFSWTTNLNISKNIDKITDLGLDSRIPIFVPVNGKIAVNPGAYLVVGQPIGLWYGYKAAGVYQIEDFESVTLANGTPVKFADVKWTLVKNYRFKLKPGVPDNANSMAKPGDRKYQDLDKNGIINGNDQDYIGKYQPKFTGGFTNNFKYKAFNLRIFTTFQIGGEILNGNRLLLDGAGFPDYNVSQRFGDNRWRAPMFDAQDLPIPGTGNASNEYISGIGYSQPTVLYDGLIEDGSYFRIANVTLGYNFPNTLSKKMGVKNLRIYGTANNLYVFTNYSGYDPEVNTGQGGTGTLAPGLDVSSYPRSRMIQFGLNVTF